MEDMVIPDVMDDLILPQGRYPESFMLTSLLEVCQEGRVLNRGTWRIFVFFSLNFNNFIPFREFAFLLFVSGAHYRGLSTRSEMQFNSY